MLHQALSEMKRMKRAPNAASDGWPSGRRSGGFGKPCRQKSQPSERGRVFRAFISIVLLSALTLSLYPLPSRAAAPRFGLDQQNSRQVRDEPAEMKLPFQKLWQLSLGGAVESQPIFCGGSIYVQAGDRLFRLSPEEGRILAVSPKLTDSPLASGSSPSFSYTVFGPRIYQATRDHRLWALDPDTLTPLWREPGYFVLSAGGQPRSRYRITSSPLAVNQEGRTLIALGTANGDQTGLSGQFADNGFFILEDLGGQAKARYCRRLKGEVTGSPALMASLVVATQNIGAGSAEDRDLLLCYDLAAAREISETAAVPTGIPGSPAVEGNRVWLADGQGRLYCYEKQEDGPFRHLWTNGDERAGSVNLNSPTIGGSRVYLPVRREKGGGGGLLVAIDKETGETLASRRFGSQLCANLVYWRPAGAGEGFLMVYEASGQFSFLNGTTLEPEEGFVDETGRKTSGIRLADAVAGQKVSDPVMSEGYLLLVDSKGTLHVYQGQGPQEGTAVGDLSLLSLTGPARTVPDKAETVRARVKNNTEQALTDCTLEWYEDGELNRSQRLDLGPLEEKTVPWLWPGRPAAGLVQLEARVSPPEGMVDLAGEDNRGELSVEVVPAGEVDCGEIRESGRWRVSYRILTGYETGRYVDCGGLPLTPCRWTTYTDYARPIYRTEYVDYSEELRTAAVLSTGQGKPGPADGDAPADSGGRGAWEIIPYAKEKGLDPDKIARAGAGISLRVETIYTTNWEYKVPYGARAYGGGNHSAREVSAEIYDTRGRLIQKLALEKTAEKGNNGPRGDTRITQVWELPEISHTYLDGKNARVRCFFTSPELPDGKLRVLVKVSGAGRNGLYSCEIAEAEIYGSVYDDIYSGLSPG